MEHLSNDVENHPSQHKNNHNLRNETSPPISQKVNGNWDNTMIRIIRWRESHCKTNTSNRKEKEI